MTVMQQPAAQRTSARPWRKWRIQRHHQVELRRALV
jgi:hypothetical protein